MKTITLPLAPPAQPVGAYTEYVVEVNWFPRLTEAQLLENAIAAEIGNPQPHPNPNLISVLVPSCELPLPQDCALIVTTPARLAAIRDELRHSYVGGESTLVGEFADDADRAIVMAGKPHLRIRS